MMWQYGNGMGCWGFQMMAVGGLLVWALIVVGVIATLRHVIRESAVSRLLPADPRPRNCWPSGSPAGTSPSTGTHEHEYRDGLDVLRTPRPTRPPDPCRGSRRS